mmetsp:Transcript_9443/g.22739  ORF Transcript_9443/g.22739 Transcript_9443/m.22739 type:complete len:212 (+) Transcript_9443:1625-2260(+)
MQRPRGTAAPPRGAAAALHEAQDPEPLRLCRQHAETANESTHCGPNLASTLSNESCTDLPMSELLVQEHFGLAPLPVGAVAWARLFSQAARKKQSQHPTAHTIRRDPHGGRRGQQPLSCKAGGSQPAAGSADPQQRGPHADPTELGQRGLAAGRRALHACLYDTNPSDGARRRLWSSAGSPPLLLLCREAGGKDGEAATRLGENRSETAAA